MNQTHTENNHNTQSYWLYLHPYVHLSVKKERALLYNSLNYHLLEYPKDSPVFPLLKRLASHHNLYVIHIKAKDITPTIATFIEQIRQFFCGDILDTALSTKKPLQLKPILNLQKTLQTLTMENDSPRSLTGDEIPDYLNTITLYMNDLCSKSCSMCQDGYKQWINCRQGKKHHHEITIDNLQTLIQQTQNSKLFKLNITGGDLFSYSFLVEAMQLLNPIPVLKVYYLHYLNIQAHPSFFKLLHDGNNRLALLVHFPVSMDILDQHMAILKEQEVMKLVDVRFIIENETHMDVAHSLISHFQLQRYRYIPYFNGKNLAFFQEHVFLNRAGILESEPQMNDILARTVLNTSNFKKLTIFNDLSVYPNVNFPKIGELGRHHLMALVYKALHHSPSWTIVRPHVAPCKSCTFNQLCPPISNYESTIGQYNLCHIY
jgi:pseudo-rSAM protein